MTTTLFALAAALAAQTLPAPGAVTWEAVAEDSGGRYSIDPTTIVRDGDRVRFLMRALAARAEADGTDSAVVRYVIDCRARTAGMLAADFYRGDAFANALEIGAEDLELRPIADGTGEVQLHRRVCGG
ncbi:MAG: hypothetical protein QOD42_35 [Sphingomonadales bacterium]|jgi:hypothetical protein|nr:hypothetical protein [Sphingomonadales bacterium]